MGLQSAVITAFRYKRAYGKNNGNIEIDHRHPWGLNDFMHHHSVSSAPYFLDNAGALSMNRAEDLLRINNFGPKKLENVMQQLAAHGLALATKAPTPGQK